MARTRELKVVVSGDADKLDKELKRSGRSLDKLGKQTKLTSTISSKGFAAMRLGATGAAAAVGGLAILGKQSVSAAIEAEKSQAKLKAQLDASGLSYKKYGKQIEAVIKNQSEFFAFDDEDLADSFTNIVRVTGDVDKALGLNIIAMDLARAKNLDLAKAGEIVGKVAGGNTGVLGRYGIKIKEGATATEALAAMQQKFGGQAKAYGETTAGSADRAAIAYENLQEVIGGALAPVIEKVSTRFAKFVNEMQDGTGEGGRFVDRLEEIWEGAKPIVLAFGRAARAVGQFAAKHPELAKLAGQIIAVGLAVKGLRFLSAASGFSGMLKAGHAAAKGLKSILTRGGASAGAAAANSMASTAGASIGPALDRNAKSFRGGRWTTMGRAAGKTFGLAAAGLAIWHFKDEINGFFNDFSKTKVGGILTAPSRLGTKIGEELGKLLGTGGDGPGRLPKGPANLRGANRSLKPYAEIGAGFGLQVSSGLRPGARTAVGKSYHSSGEAIDVSGSSGGMMRYFRALKSRYGGRLAELIYTPGGVGIKDGRPHRYTGKVASDHYDHVHVALDLGQAGPGIGPPGRLNRPVGSRPGDGIGRTVSAARSVGLSGTRLVNAVAIAGAESNYDPSAQNLKYPDHSIGLWQINQLAHKGRYGTDAKLKNPVANARAMKAISGGGKNWSPWSTWTNGAYRSYLTRARQAVVGGRTPAKKSSTGGTKAPSSSSADQPSAYELSLAKSDVAVAQAAVGGGVKDDVQAQVNRAGILKRRLDKVNTALRKKGLTKATRKRLLEEKAQLIGDLRQTGETVAELLTPEGADTATDAAQALEDALQPLIDAIQEYVRIQEAHTEALKENAAAQQASLAFAQQVNATTEGSLRRSLVGLVSGDIAQGYIGRGRLPGAGALSRV